MKAQQKKAEAQKKIDDAKAHKKELNDKFEDRLQKEATLTKQKEVNTKKD